MTHDLTTGKPLRDIWQFAVPVLFGLLLQQVYSLVDTAIVGHALGVMALGGVGATGSVNFLVIGFCGGLCTGMAIPLAQAFGAGDYRQLRRYVAGCVWLGHRDVRAASGADAADDAGAAEAHGHAGGADGLRL